MQDEYAPRLLPPRVTFPCTQLPLSCRYLDDDEWQKAIPVHKYNMALQVVLAACEHCIPQQCRLLCRDGWQPVQWGRR